MVIFLNTEDRCMCMSIKKMLFASSSMILCLLLTGCASGAFGQGGMYAQSSSDMGMNYLLGRGVPQNNAKAFAYFSKAADEDDVFAQNEVAYMYAAGKGTTRDYKKALMYYKKAADHDLASAQFNLGLLYANGLGTEANKALAREWFQKSAAHGFEPAQVALKQYSS